MTGLPVSRLVAVSINLSPSAALFANFDTLLIVGDSDVIDTGERIRSYSSISALATDYGTSAPEYLAALLPFSQVPQLGQLYVGRWAQAATHARLTCGILTAAQQLLSAWTAITTGSFKITIDGGAQSSLTGLDFHLAASMAAVAAVIQAGLTGATCAWVNDHFEIKSSSTGASSTLTVLTAGASGVDISAQMKGTTSTSQRLVAGIVAESALAATTILDALSTKWYGLMFASTHIVDADHSAIAAYIEAASRRHIYGLTTQNTAAIASGDTTSIGYVLSQAGYKRSFAQYSSTNAYASASVFGRAFTVNFDQSLSTITVAYKTEPGVTAETLTESQANALDANRYMYFANFNNGTAILVNGTMCGAAYFDEIHGTDWLANRIETDLYNVLYTALTKVPQTDAGNHLLATTIESSCAIAVANGLLAPGTWTTGGFGQLKQGDFLDKGYYVYQPPIANQSTTDRSLRKSVNFQVAAKLAGAIQSTNVTVNVNR